MSTYAEGQEILLKKFKKIQMNNFAADPWILKDQVAVLQWVKSWLLAKLLECAILCGAFRLILSAKTKRQKQSK